ncbi:carboxyl transferase domain-containing protein [Streptomyces arboris]|uniref:Acetyl-coenzyme A carboxylase carboxyl transferase subunit beta n=1 Tax=Streptomyces arboris TaxID=2600619 RepID=A0A5N5EUV3_9ACTN|nr:carboxyl transferase domain-containing protein [Streptomyces arboris]KAB2594313.1 hypothetical protein F5983_00820 [Streptomyces arboris]
MTTTAPPLDTHVPDWILCPGCRAPVYGKRFVRNDRVCPHCGRHSSLTAPERLAGLLDPGGAEPLVHPVRTGDPLGFVDVRAYPERLREARERTGLDEAVLCARGTVRGLPLIVAVMDFRFLGGSLGSAVGGLIAHAADTALRERTPLLLVTASGGARMQEGALALMQMATTSQAMARLDEAGILTMSLITDPTYGGVAASFASLSDVIIAEPGARMGFAGARVIEQTIRQSLPPGFQTAESLLSRGFIDLVCPRSGLRTKLARLLSFAAGEVEFLVDDTGDFYFMEVNCRIQVEHPVTEMVTGVDLVREQFRVAAGLPLELSQSGVAPRGAAIECRVNAEDPARDFLPTPGPVEEFTAPAGPFVRVDTDCFPGHRVSAAYDPLLAKVITWAPDRAQARERMRRALDEFHVSGPGVRTNIPFLRRVLDDPRFADGTHTTSLVADLTSQEPLG